VLLAPCWIVVEAARAKHLRGKAAAAKYAISAPLVLLATILAYFHYNHEHFGHSLTISAMLKSTFPTPRLPTWEQLRLMKHCYPGIIAAAFALVFLARAPRTDRPAQIVVITSLWAILHACFVLFFTRWPAYGIWWWLPSYLCLSLTIGLVGSRRLGARSALMVILAIAVWQACAIADAVVRYPDAPEGEMGSQYAAAIPKDAVVFQVDATGMTSYLADRRVINGDGLMNNLEYQDAVATGGLLDYFAKYGVTHIVHDEAEVLSADVLSQEYEFAALPVPAHFYDKTVTLRMPRQWESARWSVAWPGQRFPWPRDEHVQTFVAWRLPEDRSQWSAMHPDVPVAPPLVGDEHRTSKNE